MSGWSFFFIVVGASFLAAQPFRLLEIIERPPRRRRRRTAEH